MCSGHFRRHAHVLQHLFRPNQTILLFFTIPAHRFQLTSCNRHTKHPKLPCPYLEDYPIRKWVTHGTKKLIPGTVLQSQADLVFTDDLQQVPFAARHGNRVFLERLEMPRLGEATWSPRHFWWFQWFLCIWTWTNFFFFFFFPKEKGEQFHPKNDDGWWLCRLHGWVSIHQSSLWVLDRLGHRPWIPSCRWKITCCPFCCPEKAESYGNRSRQGGKSGRG